MTKPIEEKLLQVPILKWFVRLAIKIKIPGLEGMSLYDLLEMYTIGIVKGALTSRAGGISFSFFMAVFPFMLFILTLIPYVPIDGFQENFTTFMSQLLPPKTYGAVEVVLEDIINNKYGGLLSFGFIVSIFLMTNGVNAIFGGFEYSYHVVEVRSVVRAYIIALGISLVMAFFLLLTVAVTIFFEMGIQKLKAQGWVEDDVFWIQNGRIGFFIVMLFTTVSTLYHFGTKEGKHSSFFSAGAVLTTILSIITFYVFGIYVVKFSQYNELYGSIGTLLVIMLFIWLNSIILLLGFELNASLNRLKKRHQRKKLNE